MRGVGVGIYVLHFGTLKSHWPNTPVAPCARYVQKRSLCRQIEESGIRYSSDPDTQPCWISVDQVIGTTYEY